MKLQKLIDRTSLAIAFMALFSLVFSSFANIAFAAGTPNTQYLQFSSNVPSASSVTHTVHFKPSTTTAIKQIDIKYCSANSSGGWAAACTAPAGLVLPASNNVTLTGFGSNVLTSSSFATPMESAIITTPAAETTATDHQIAIATVTNPSAAGTFYIRVRTYSDTGTTVIDEGFFAAATIASVSVSGTQRESLTFTMSAVAVQALINGSGLSTDAASTVAPNTVPFGDFKAATASSNVAHRVKVATNATSGFTLTLVESALLTSGSNTIADFGGGSTGVDAGSAWTEATTTGFGVNAKSVSGSEVNTTTFGTSTTGPTTLYKKLTAGTPVTISSSAGVSSGYDAEVNYRVAVPGSLPAGVYTNTLNYVATPTY